MSTEKPWWKSTEAKIGVAICALLLLQNVILMYQVRTLSTVRAAAPAVRPNPPDEPLKVGDALPEVQASGLDGRPRSLQTAKLLFIYSENCKYCKANFSNWEAIVRKVGKDKVLFVSLDPMENAQQFAKQKKIESQVVVLPNRFEMARLKAFRFPQTIAVNDAKVQAIRVGVLSESEVADFSR